MHFSHFLHLGFSTCIMLKNEKLLLMFKKSSWEKITQLKTYRIVNLKFTEEWKNSKMALKIVTAQQQKQ